MPIGYTTMNVSDNKDNTGDLLLDITFPTQLTLRSK